MTQHHSFSRNLPLYPFVNYTVCFTQESDVVKQLKKLLTDKCQELASKEDKTEFTEVMEGQHSIGFLISERFINIPPQIAVPVYKTLRYG